MRFIVILFVLIARVLSKTINAYTTSGRLLGTEADGVVIFKGIRFARPPVDNLRWEPPVAFISSDIQNATSLGPSCITQYPFQAISQELNLPPESEDCLFLNVWAPAPISGPLNPVVVWFYGGGYQLGTASIPLYDGTSFAKNQDIVFVSFNYRTNVFGFPTAEDLPASGNNLGLLDQELALAWVQDNIAKFGGDKSKVTLMGHSAGSESVSLAITRRNSTLAAPFRAAIMLSGAQVSTPPIPKFTIFDEFATAMGCGQPPGPQRLNCLRNIPATTIRNYTSGPNGVPFTPGVDNVTLFDDPLQRIRQGQIAQVPILLGSMEDDGSIIALGLPTNLSATISEVFGPFERLISPDLVRALYPGLNDSQVIAAGARDYVFRCPVKLWSDAFVSSGIKSVYRYTYGAVFADLEPSEYPSLGVYHGSELPLLFGTFNRSTASAAEAELSQSLQAAFANFVKYPVNAPAPNWPAYEPGFLGIAPIPTLAEIAYEGNVGLDDFVKPVQPISKDGPCIILDAFLDFRP